MRRKSQVLFSLLLLGAVVALTVGLQSAHASPYLKPTAPPTPNNPPATEKPPPPPTPIPPPPTSPPTKKSPARPTSTPPLPSKPSATEPPRQQPTSPPQPTREAAATVAVTRSPGAGQPVVATVAATLTTAGGATQMPELPLTQSPPTPPLGGWSREDPGYLRPARYPPPWVVLAGAVVVLLVLGAIGFVIWLVVHNVRYTQRDLALKAAQVLSVPVGDDQVLELLARYAYGATRQRLALMDAAAVGSPVPHIRATTMNGDVEVAFTTDGKSLAQYLRESASHRVRRYPLTLRNAGLLVVEKMQQIWTLLAEKGGLSPVERVLPCNNWTVFLIERASLRKRRHTHWWWR